MSFPLIRKILFACFFFILFQVSDTFLNNFICMFVSNSSDFNALKLEIFDLYAFILFQVLISVSTFFLQIKVSFCICRYFNFIITKFKSRNTAFAQYMEIHLRSANSFAAFAASLYLFMFIFDIIHVCAVRLEMVKSEF